MSRPRAVLRVVDEDESGEMLEGMALRQPLEEITRAASNLNQQLKRKSFSRSVARRDFESMRAALREFEQHARAEPPFLISRPRYKAYVYEAFDREESSALAAEAREILLNPAEDTLLRIHACTYLHGHLAELRRTRSGDYTLADAIALDDAERDPAAAATRLIPLSGMLRRLPAVALTADDIRRARNGQNLPGRTSGPGAPYVRLLDAAGDFIGIAEPAGPPGLLHPFVVLG